MMRLKSKIKLITTLVSFLMIGAAAISSTVAFLYTTDKPVTNVFLPSQVQTAVVEDITSVTGEKREVKIQNTGDTTAWIRAAVVITWQDKDGNVYGQMPVAGTDYDISYNVDSTATDTDKWHLGEDGFYYWPQPVKSVKEDNTDCTTGILINSCQYVENAPANYHLTVEILGSGIQTFQGEAYNTYDKAWAKVVTTP